MTNWIIVNINRVEICITTDKENSERARVCAYRNYSIVNGGRDFVYFGVETPF